MTRPFLFLLLPAAMLVAGGGAHAQCTANAGPAGYTICAGGPQQLNGTANSGQAPYSFVWTPATGLSDPNIANPVCTATVTTVYTLTVTDGNGDVCTDNITITVLPTAVATLTSSNALFTVFNGVPTFYKCSANPNSLFFFDFGGTAIAGATHAIDWGDASPDYVVTGATWPTQSHTYSQGIYTLTYTITQPNGCNDSQTYSVFLGTNPAGALVNPGSTAGCGPLTLTFPIVGWASNTPGTIYTVTFNDGTAPIVYSHPPPASITHVFAIGSCGTTSTDGLNTYQNSFSANILIENPCGTSGSTVLPITVSLAGQSGFTISPNDTACVNSTVTFTSTSTGNEIQGAICDLTPALLWSIAPAGGWTIASGSLGNDNGFFGANYDPSSWLTGSQSLGINFNLPGQYAITLITGNSCGGDTLTQNVCIESPPVPAFTLLPNTGCAPLVSTVDNTSVSPNSCLTQYVWSVVFNGAPCGGAGTWSYSGGTSATSFEPQFTFTSPGNYTVTLQAINSCGTFPVSQSVTVGSPPQVTLNPLPTICAGQSVSPSATFTPCGNAITTYGWTFTGGAPGSSALQNPGSITYNTGGSFTVTASATNACGTVSDSEPLTVNPVPPAPVVNGPITLCAGQTLNLSLNTIPGATYSWTGPGGWSSSLEDPTITNITTGQAGNYVVTANIGGCIGPSSTVVVVVNNAPAVNIVPMNPSICAGASVMLTANGSSNYTWTANGLPAGAGASITQSPAVTTVYVVTATPGGGCPRTATTTVTVNPLPVVNAGPNVTLCDQPIPYTLLGFSPAGGIWSGSPNVTAGGVFTPNGTGNFTLTYTYTNGNGCVGSDQITVTIDPLGPPANAGPNEALCVGDPAIQLPLTPPGGTWTGTGVTPGGLFTPTAAGSFNLTYTVGVSTCQTSDVMTVTVSALPVVSAGPDFSACSTDPVVNLIGAPAGGTWSGSGVTGSQWDPATAGTGANVLSYTYTNAAGCTASDQVIATLFTLPVVDAGGPWNLCDQPIATTLTGAAPLGGVWSGPFITPGGSFGGSGIGVFTVYYSYSDPNGCSGIDSTVVTVIAVLNPANAGPDEVVCIGSTPFGLAAIPVGGTWSGSPFVAPNGTFTPSTAGTYVLTYTVGNGSCLTSDAMVVTVDPLPTVNAGNPASYCINATPAQQNGTPVGGTWSGTGVSPGGLFDPAAAGIGAHTLTYSYTSPVGCFNSNTVTLTVNPLPVVDAGPPVVFCDQPFPQQLTGFSPAGGTWSGSPFVTNGGQFTPNGVGTFILTYTYTDANGCTNSDNMQVDVVPIVNPATAGADVEICVGQPPFQLAGAPGGGSWSGTPLVTPTGTFDPSVAGVYVLTYTVGTLTCLTADQMTVTVHQLPQPAITSTPTVCFDAGLQTMTANPAGGTWSGAGIIDPVLGIFDPAVTGVGVFNITYTYTDANGCTNSTASLATVNALPVAAFTSDPIACLNAPFQFTDLSVGATGWAWDFGDNGTSGVQNPQHTYAALGQYTITLIASTGAGCDDTTSMVIDVWEPPYPSFTVAPDSGCGPLTLAFTNTSTGNITGSNWDFGNGTSTTAQFPPPVTFQQGVVADTTYAITLTASNVCGNVDAVDSVQVMPAPTALFGTDYSQGCSPFTPLIANISYGLPDTYFWDFGDGTTGTTSAALFTHTYLTDTVPTTYTITLIVVNECGSDTTTQQVTVLPNTVTAFFNTDPSVGCSPLTVDFTQFTSGATFTSWDFGDGNVSALQDPSHTFFAGANDTTFTVTLYANNGCSFDTAYATVTVFAQPIVGFTYAPDSVCVNVPFQFTNTSQNAANYIWDFGDGSGSGLTDPSHAYTSGGIYPVMLTATSQLNGCVDSVIVPVTVITSPVVNIGVAPLFGCMPLDVQFTNTTTNAVFYTWDFDDGNTSGLQTPSHTYASDGVYLVQLIAENLSGCSDTGYTQVNVYPIPDAAFTFSPGQSCVSPADVQFDNNSSGAIGFEWDLGNGQTTALNDPVGTYGQPGTYTIELVATNQYGCTDTASADFTVYPTPVADYTVLPNPACATYPVQFTDNSQNNSIWQWYFGDGGTSTDEDPTYTYMLPGAYDITLIVQGAGGCTDTLIVDDGMIVNPTPVAEFSYDTLLSIDNALQFNNLSTGSTSWWWDFGDSETSTDFEPVHLFPADGDDLVICLIATNELQCPDTVCKVIVVPSDVNAYVPNTFTPDGDGLNDGFRPIMVGFDDGRWNYHFMIFDRWGQLFFDSYDRSQEWDGTFNGQQSPIDVYVWKVIMSAEGDERDWVGHVTLVR